LSQSNAPTEKMYGLCVDDEPEILKLVVECMKAVGFEPLSAQSAEEAFEIIKKNGQDIAIVASDFSMPKENGLELRARMLEMYKDLPFVIVSGVVNKEITMKAVEYRVSAFVDKPFKSADLTAILKEQSKARIEAIEERRVLAPTYFQESSDLLEEVEPLFLALESHPEDEATVNAIFRIIHTIKGGSGVIGRPDFTGYVHAFEDVLSKIKDKKLTASPEIVSLLLKNYDQIGGALNALRTNDPLPFDVKSEVAQLKAVLGANREVAIAKTAATAAPKANAASGSARKDGVFVPSTLLDQFMAMSGEITVIRNMVNKLVTTLERKIPGDDDVGLLGELLDEMHKINSGMQTQITELRKIPMSQILSKLPRTVRDLSKSLGKEVILNVEGDDLKVDNSIAQALSGSLVHMIRNCVDHGIEMPDVRLRNGKAGAGAINIKCEEAGEFIKVLVFDDGGGINTEKIKKKLVEKNLYPKDVIDSMTEKKLVAQIFESGFSTAAQITDVSGRGVGMDMVKTSIEALRGKIEVDSKLGQGTNFVIFVPIPKSVVIIHSLIVKCGAHTFAIPQDDVVRLIQVEEERRSQIVRTLEGAEAIEIDGHLVPVIRLDKTLGIEEPVVHIGADIVVAKCDRGTFALMVDKVLDAEDVVVKPLAKYVATTEVFKGATFMGDGSVGLILDVEGLAKRSQIEDLRGAATVSDSKTITGERDVLAFHIGTGSMYGLDLARVYRLERFKKQQVQTGAGRRVMIYRETIMPLFNMKNIVEQDNESFSESNSDELAVIVFKVKDGFVGYEITEISDILRTASEIEPHVVPTDGVKGAFIHGEQTITEVDVDGVLKMSGFGIEEEVVTEAELPKQEIESVGGAQAAAANANEPAFAVVGDGWGLF